MIRLAEKHGIVVFLDPMETINWLPTLRNNGLAACAAYGKYLGSRYKDFPNVVWLHGNDFSSWKNGPGDGGLVQAVAKGIKSEDPGHLQTVELMLDPSTQRSNLEADHLAQPGIYLRGHLCPNAGVLQRLARPAGLSGRGPL